MIIWATLPYAIWQLSYHFLITVRKRTKIAAGRPTSFTWLRRSYRGNFLGQFVLGFPESMQEAVFMGIQYLYALLTMLPCPLWFWYRWASAAFMLAVFAWASWNGATYYIDVFGKRMEKELEQLRKEVQRMAKSPEMLGQTPMTSPSGPQGMEEGEGVGGMDGAVEGDGETEGVGRGKSSSLDLGPSAAAAHGNGLGNGNGNGVLHQRTKSEVSHTLTDVTTDATTTEDGEGEGEGEGLESAATTPGLELKKTFGKPEEEGEGEEEDKYEMHDLPNFSGGGRVVNGAHGERKKDE